MEYLDCECTYFPSMKDDDPIMSAYSYARRTPPMRALCRCCFARTMRPCGSA